MQRQTGKVWSWRWRLRAWMTRQATPHPVRPAARLTVASALCAGLFVLVMTAGAAVACECAPTTVGEAREQADAVLAGTVKSLRWVDSPREREPRVVIDMDVARVWKGDVGRTFTLHTNLAAGSCRGIHGNLTEAGSLVLVYATAATGTQWRALDYPYGPRNKDPDYEPELPHIVDQSLIDNVGDTQRLFTTLTCSRTQPVVDAVEDFDQLGAFTERTPLTMSPDALRQRLLQPANNGLPAGCVELGNARLWTAQEPSAQTQRIIRLMVDVRLLEATGHRADPLAYTHHWVIDRQQRVGYCRLLKDEVGRCGETHMIFEQDADGSWRSGDGTIGAACSHSPIRRQVLETPAYEPER